MEAYPMSQNKKLPDGEIRITDATMDYFPSLPSSYFEMDLLQNFIMLYQARQIFAGIRYVFQENLSNSLIRVTNLMKYGEKSV